MGQYFLLVNEDKREYVSSRDIGGGAKLWEWIVNINECGVITSMLMNGWSGDRIALVGDYDKSKLFGKAYNLYKNTSKLAKSLYDKNIKLTESKSKLYAINETTNEYISGTFKQISICLTLLLRMSSAGGGGDIYEDYITAGKWAENKIVIKDKQPSNKYNNINSAVYSDAFDFYGTD